MVQLLWRQLCSFLQNLTFSYHAIQQLLSFIFTQIDYVYGSFIHNCQNLEATKILSSSLMDKLWYTQTMMYFLCEVLFLKRNEQSSYEKYGRNFHAYY